MQRLMLVADNSRLMTPPRHIEKGQLVDITMQTVGRSFRFLPTPEVRDSLDFIFALVVAKYGLLVHEYEFMSNHLHFIATDVRGELPNFMRDFDSLVARQLNAIRGTSGSNIEKGYGLIHISDERKLLEKAVYVLANAVSAHLVRRVKEWKGPNSLRLEYGRKTTLKRPKCGIWKETLGAGLQSRFESRGRLAYRGRSRTPEEVDFMLVRPPTMKHLSDTKLRQIIRDKVEDRERELITQRSRTRQKVLGMRRVVEQHYLDTPQHSRVLFETKPRVSGTDVGKRVDKLQTILNFEAAYRRARDAWLAGDPRRVFPFGTWLMRVRFGVCCATAPL